MVIGAALQRSQAALNLRWRPVRAQAPRPHATGPSPLLVAGSLHTRLEDHFSVGAGRVWGAVSGQTAGGERRELSLRASVVKAMAMC